MFEFIYGPKLYEVEYLELFEKILSANLKYPDNGSITCCQGLVEDGFLIIIFLPSYSALTISGTILFFAQSPPPITFPALALENAKKFEF